MVGAFKRHVLMVWYIEGQCIEVIERSGVGYHLMMGRFLIAKLYSKLQKWPCNGIQLIMRFNGLYD